MATKKEIKSETTYRIDRAKLMAQLETNDTCNWLVEKGVEQFKAGKIPGKLMIAFLEQLNILSVEK